MVFTVLANIVLCPFSHTLVINNTSLYVLVQDLSSFYAPSQHGWNWKYLVLLDRSSYSRQFCIADTAWESDLEGWQQKQCH